MKAEAEVSPEGLATLAQPLADKTTTDKTSPILNDLGPVALPRIGKKERKEALEEFRKGKGKSGGARARERLGLPPAKRLPCPSRRLANTMSAAQSRRFRVVDLRTVFSDASPTGSLSICKFPR